MGHGGTESPRIVSGDETGVQLADLVDVNREQLQERVVVDAHFIQCHWDSQRTLVAFLPLPAKQVLTFLDLGCGPNADILSLLPDVAYTGIDFVPGYVAGLRRRYPETGPFPFSRRQFIAASMEYLPFPDESYDVVYSRHTLEHVPDLRHALSEIDRVLRPGGRFIFCVPAAAKDEEPAHVTRWRAHRWLRAIGSIVSIKCFGQHDYFIDELYGYGVKPGGESSPILSRMYHLLRRVYNLRGYSLSWPFRRMP